MTGKAAVLAIVLMVAIVVIVSWATGTMRH